MTFELFLCAGCDDEISYNHGIPAVLKNALDYAYPEWNKKAAGFVGYGAVGGARAIEHLRLVDTWQEAGQCRRRQTRPATPVPQAIL